MSIVCSLFSCIPFNFYFIFLHSNIALSFVVRTEMRNDTHTRTNRARKNAPDVFTLAEDAHNSTLYLNSKLIRSHPHSSVYKLRAAQNSHQISGQFETGENKSFNVVGPPKFTLHNRSTEIQLVFTSRLIWEKHSKNYYY